MVNSVTQRLYDEQQLRAVTRAHEKAPLRSHAGECVAFDASILVMNLSELREALQTKVLGYENPEEWIVLAEAALQQFVDEQLHGDQRTTWWTLR